MSSSLFLGPGVGRQGAAQEVHDVFLGVFVLSSFSCFPRNLPGRFIYHFLELCCLQNLPRFNCSVEEGAAEPHSPAYSVLPGLESQQRILRDL